MWEVVIDNIGSVLAGVFFILALIEGLKINSVSLWAKRVQLILEVTGAGLGKFLAEHDGEFPKFDEYRELLEEIYQAISEKSGQEPDEYEKDVAQEELVKIIEDAKNGKK